MFWVYLHICSYRQLSNFAWLICTYFTYSWQSHSLYLNFGFAYWRWDFYCTLAYIVATEKYLFSDALVFKVVCWFWDFIFFLKVFLTEIELYYFSLFFFLQLPSRTSPMFPLHISFFFFCYIHTYVFICMHKHI